MEFPLKEETVTGLTVGIKGEMTPCVSDGAGHGR